MLHGTSLTLFGILGVLSSSVLAPARAHEPKRGDSSGASSGSCLLQTARGALAKSHRLDTNAFGEPIECHVLLPLLTERSDHELKRLCEKDFPKSSCQEANDALLQRPWSVKAVGEACKHLGRGAPWHLRSDQEAIALLQRSGHQHSKALSTFDVVGAGWCRPNGWLKGCWKVKAHSTCRVSGFYKEQSDETECKFACIGPAHATCLGYAISASSHSEAPSTCYVYTSGGGVPSGWSPYVQDKVGIGTSSGVNGVMCYRRQKETEADTRNGLDESLKFKRDDENQLDVQQPPYNESGRVKRVPSGVYDVTSSTPAPATSSPGPGAGAGAGVDACAPGRRRCR